MFFFLFVTAIISLVVTTKVMCIICRNAKLKCLVTSLALQQIRGADMKQEHVSLRHDIGCTCKTQGYTIVSLFLIALGIMIFIVINAGGEIKTV